jgi:hypothetical protein
MNDLGAKSTQSDGFVQRDVLDVDIKDVVHSMYVPVSL